VTTFLHIGIAFADAPKVVELEPVFNKALDWLRYAPNCYVVKTKRSPRTWLQRLRPHLSSGDHVFIVQVDVTQRGGLLPRWAWDWLAAQSATEEWRG